MGDLNDNPCNQSVESYLNAAAHPDSLTRKQLYNTTYKLYNTGKGTLKYRGNWYLFDQLIISQALLKNQKYKYKKSVIYNSDYLLQKEGKYKGYPFRTHGGMTYLNGYSDHLPVYLILSKD
jgi:hypothetical protein